MPDHTGSDSRGGPDTHQDFMRLADAALPAAYRLAAHILSDRSEAEDATQEALVLAWRGWPRLRDAARFGVWFDRILVNVCYERLRGRKRSPVEALPPELGAKPGDPFAAAVARDAVSRALVALTPEQRIVVVLRFWRDLPIEEIAERLRIPSGTVRSRLFYALRTLKAEIDRAEPHSMEAKP